MFSWSAVKAASLVSPSGLKMKTNQHPWDLWCSWTAAEGIFESCLSTLLQMSACVTQQSNILISSFLVCGFIPLKSNEKGIFIKWIIYEAAELVSTCPSCLVVPLCASGGDSESLKQERPMASLNHNSLNTPEYVGQICQKSKLSSDYPDRNPFLTKHVLRILPHSLQNITEWQNVCAGVCRGSLCLCIYAEWQF